MTDRTLAGECAAALKKLGSGGEEVHQTLALCHIADMLTAIAYDIHAIRETHTTEGDDR